MSSRETPQESIILLQILRALAAIMVLVAHSGHEASAIAARLGLAAPSFEVIDWGFGVHLFFVISGFIMVLTSAGRFGRPGAWKAFLARRIERIVPLYWVLTTVLLLGALVAPRLLNVPIEDWRSIATSYFFLPFPRGNGEIRPVMALGWTLNFEMLFYAVFALCMLLPLKRGLVALVAIFLGLVLMGRIAELPTAQLRTWAAPITLEFICGVLIGLVHRRGIRLGLAARLAAAIGGVALLVAFGMKADDASGLFAIATNALPAALLVAAAALGAQPSPKLRGVAALAFLGDASYSLYLIQPFALRPMREIWLALVGGALPPALSIAAGILAGIAAGVLCHLLLERPMARFLRNRRAGRAPAAALAFIQPPVSRAA